MILRENLLIDKNHVDTFNKCTADAQNGKGSVIAVSGEDGFGKTSLINYLYNLSSGKNSNIFSIFVEGQAPIGSVNVANLQPLLPFSKAIEKILNPKDTSAKKKFLMNAGMTLLASLPGTDLVFYAVKELGRDWRQYKQEKSSEKVKDTKKTSAVTADYYDTICSFADKNPVALFFDDLHWCDAQSVELLMMLVKNIESIPIIIVFSYSKSTVISKGLPILPLLDLKQIHSIELTGFDKEQISKLCKHYFQNYNHNKEFEDWLYSQTFGMPSHVIEYLKHYRQNPPFDKNGKFIDNLSDTAMLPNTMSHSFSLILERVSDDEKNLLSTCSSEGREFSVVIVANLLNTDILTAIKKLRALQNKTGFIKSIGSKVRYGVKTTCYEFTTGFYHSYFENLLEFEEYIALHGQIASLLKQKYEDAASEEIRQQIAPYVAAHSAEAGDEETAKSMLLFAAQTAKKYGNNEVLQNFYDTYVNVKSRDMSDSEEINALDTAFKEMVQNKIKIDTGNGNGDLSGDNEPSQEAYIHDFNTVRNTIVEHYLKGKFLLAAEFGVNYYDNNTGYMRQSEKAQILSLIAKSFIELKDFVKASDYLRLANELIKSGEDSIAECIVFNLNSAFNFYQKNYKEAYEFLKHAVEKSEKLPPEMKLITLSNVALFLEHESPDKSDKYFNAVRRLASNLNFDELSKDIFD